MSNALPSKSSINFIPIATVRRAHGVRGELRVTLDNPDDTLPSNVETLQLRPAEGAPRQVRIEAWRPVNDAVLVRLEGVADRDAAQRLAGARLEIDSAAVPPAAAGDAYLYEIQGAEAYDAATEASLGKVSGFVSNGAQMLVCLGDDRLLPWTADTFVRFDRDSRRVWLKLIPGLWDHG